MSSPVSRRAIMEERFVAFPLSIHCFDFSKQPMSWAIPLDSVEGSTHSAVLRVVNLFEKEECRWERTEEVSTMNESSKEPSKATASAAQAVLARRSNEQIPLSLGKASLRMRLEAYYSLISPDTLSNRTEWLSKYDQIYEKVRPQNGKGRAAGWQPW